MCNACRFVGLLLVTKLLPAGDADTIRAVYDSVGSQFIARLLLPLRRPQVTGFSSHVFTAFLVDPDVAPTIPSCMQITEHDEQSGQKDGSACVLALAVLASSCRLSDIATREEVIEKVPLFIKAKSQLPMSMYVMYALVLYWNLASSVERAGAHHCGSACSP